jgi:hypothetical protein
MEERLQLRAVTRELNETAEIVEEATTSINRLHAELRNVQEGAESSKGESVKRLEASEKTVAVWKKELNEVIHWWPKFFSPPSTTCRSCKCGWHMRSIAREPNTRKFSLADASFVFLKKLVLVDRRGLTG